MIIFFKDIKKIENFFSHLNMVNNKCNMYIIYVYERMTTISVREHFHFLHIDGHFAARHASERAV